MKSANYRRLDGVRKTLHLHTGSLAVLTFTAVLFPSVASARFPSRGKQARASSGRHATEARASRVSEERNGSMPTRDGLRLRLVVDQGGVTIRTVHPASADPQVAYKVRIDTDAHTPNAKELLRQYVLSVRSTPVGVQIAGEMPRKSSRDGSTGSGSDLPRISVAFEVSVPFDYGLDVQTRAGDIETEDINGSVSLVTYGGNISAGRIGVTGAQALETSEAMRSCAAVAGTSALEISAGNRKSKPAAEIFPSSKPAEALVSPPPADKLTSERLRGRFVHTQAAEASASCTLPARSKSRPVTEVFA